MSTRTLHRVTADRAMHVVSSTAQESSSQASHQPRNPTAGDLGSNVAVVPTNLCFGTEPLLPANSVMILTASMKRRMTQADRPGVLTGTTLSARALFNRLYQEKMGCSASEIQVDFPIYPAMANSIKYDMRSFVYHKLGVKRGTRTFSWVKKEFPSEIIEMKRKLLEPYPVLAAAQTGWVSHEFMKEDIQRDKKAAAEASKRRKKNTTRTSEGPTRDEMDCAQVEKRTTLRTPSYKVVGTIESASGFAPRRRVVQSTLSDADDEEQPSGYDGNRLDGEDADPSDAAVLNDVAHRNSERIDDNDMENAGGAFTAEVSEIQGGDEFESENQYFNEDDDTGTEPHQTGTTFHVTVLERASDDKAQDHDTNAPPRAHTGKKQQRKSSLNLGKVRLLDGELEHHGESSDEIVPCPRRLQATNVKERHNKKRTLLNRMEVDHYDEDSNHDRLETDEQLTRPRKHLGTMAARKQQKKTGKRRLVSNDEERVTRKKKVSRASANPSRKSSLRKKIVTNGIDRQVASNHQSNVQRAGKISSKRVSQKGGGRNLLNTATNRDRSGPAPDHHVK
ncbi:hypothetical protein FGB62_17g06 [Gracilaria domingensis]|nr:hypothetical protein FGB62_17g06 [Gracilaria domingensis]